MLLLDILIALVSVGLRTAWRSSFANNRAMSQHLSQQTLGKVFFTVGTSLHARMAGHIQQHFSLGSQMAMAASSRAGWEKVPVGDRAVVSPFYSLKADTQIVYLSNLRQSKKPVAELGSALRSQPQTDGQASSTTVLSL